MNQPASSNGLNFEAIPCVLRNGPGAPVYGLLVRPITQGSVVLQSSQQSSQSTPSGPVQNQTVLPSYQTILPAVSGNKVFLPATPTITVNSAGFNGVKNGGCGTAGQYGNSGGNFNLSKPIGTDQYGNGAKIASSLNPFFIPASAVQNFNGQRGNEAGNSQTAYQMCTSDNGFISPSQHQQQISSCLTDVSPGPSQTNGVVR